jgi:hypothetical protein
VSSACSLVNESALFPSSSLATPETLLARRHEHVVPFLSVEKRMGRGGSFQKAAKKAERV